MVAALEAHLIRTREAFVEEDFNAVGIPDRRNRAQLAIWEQLTNLLF